MYMSSNNYTQTIIQIDNISDVYEFIKFASRVDGDVLVSKGKFTVDGKSFLGIFSLDISKPVIVLYPSDAGEFAEFIRPFEVFIKGN